MDPALIKLEENFLQFMNAMPEPVVLYDTEMRAIYFNPAFVETFGWSLDELFGKHIEYIPEDRLTETYNVIRRIQKGEKVKSFETVRLTKDGRMLAVRLSASLVRGQDQSPMGGVVILRDITDRKRAQEERLKRERLQGVLEMAGAACHELNQPLQAVYILLEELVEEIQSGSVNKVKKQLDSIRAIIRKIENITVYKTTDYIKGEKIIDIDEASKKG